MSSTTCNSDTNNLIIAQFLPQLVVQQRVAKKVSFSPTKDMKIIANPTEAEKQELWHGSDDVDRSKLNLAREVHLCTRMVKTKMQQGLLLSEDDRCRCLGVEHLLSDNLSANILRLSATTRNHVYAVLIEQARQRHLRTASVGELQRISSLSSQESRQRSHMIATVLMDPVS